MIRIFFMTTLLLGSTIAVAQNSFSTVEEQMTGKEFISSGLNKLTVEELEALNAWLRAHSVGTLSVAVAPSTGVDGRGFEETAIAAMDDEDIVSRVKGPFKGWDGNTIFELENGMIWKQIESNSFAMKETNDATVVIEKGVFNVWRLRVEGYNKNVRVERIQ